MTFPDGCCRTSRFGGGDPAPGFGRGERAESVSLLTITKEYPMKIMVRILVLALGLSTGTVFAADGIPWERAVSRLVGTSYVFPSSGNVQGNGAYFKTRIVVVNPTKSPMTINAVLSTPGGPVGPQAISLVSGETKVYENFLADVFGYTGGAGIRLWESTDTRPFVASAEVYADSAAGRYSTPVFGMSSDDQAARVSDTGHSLSVGLRVDSANRANFGCANADSTPVSVRVDFYTPTSGFSEPAAIVILDLPANGWQQTRVPVTGDPINIRFKTFPTSGPLGTYCYGVTVNNASADGTSIPAVYVWPSD